MNLQSQESSSVPIDLTGREFGDYQLLRRLGRGGMADVYLARQVSLNRNIALKILKPELAKDDSYVHRFRREAQAAANLIQANIVQIYEVGHSGEFHFIAQEYVQGRNLRQYITRHGAVESVMAINVIRQCAMALQKAGEAHVIHRDIKPENIMLSTKGEVKITDFGLARINNNESNQALTQVGITMGTPLYMSPEQVEGGAIDHRSDLYSLGVTAFHMLAGYPPFNGDNALTIAVQHVKDTPPNIADVRPDIPLELGAIIEKLMAKKPADRFENAKALLKELRKIKVDLDDDWELIVEKLSTAETIAMDHSGTWSQSKLAATRQLQSVMKGNLRSWWSAPGTIISLTALCLVGLLGGWGLATQTAPAKLLDVDNVTINEIPRMATVAEQYSEAQFAGYSFGTDIEEKYFLAVEEYFPPNAAPPNQKNTTKEFVRKSKARLAELYLTQNRLDEAKQIYDQFTGLEEMAGDFRATGYAGQAVVFDAMNPNRFPGKEPEKLKSISTAIGKVGTNTSGLNKFMLSRFNEVKTRLDERIEQIRTEQLKLENRDTPPALEDSSGLRPGWSIFTSTS